MLDQEPSIRLGHINAGALMVADDLAIVASDRHNLQRCVDLAEYDSKRERYNFNIDKTKIVSINTNADPSIMLNNKILKQSNQEVHLGITCSSRNDNRRTS